MMLTALVTTSACELWRLGAMCFWVKLTLRPPDILQVGAQLLSRPLKQPVDGWGGH